MTGAQGTSDTQYVYTVTQKGSTGATGISVFDQPSNATNMLPNSVYSFNYFINWYTSKNNNGISFALDTPSNPINLIAEYEFYTDDSTDPNPVTYFRTIKTDNSTASSQDAGNTGTNNSCKVNGLIKTGSTGGNMILTFGRNGSSGTTNISVAHGLVTKLS